MPKWYGGSALNPDELVAPGEQWHSQWERTVRWFRRVERLRQKSLKQELDVGDLDIALAFFQNCYHVRDWIAAAKPQLKPQMDQLFRQHFAMRACRDICNGFKHKRLDPKKSPLDPDFNLYREYDYLELMGTRRQSPVKYRTAFADGQGVRKFDLFELAQECMKIWRDFLHTTGLEGRS
jgi:hypothetical protein